MLLRLLWVTTLLSLLIRARTPPLALVLTATTATPLIITTEVLLTLALTLTVLRLLSVLDLTLLRRARDRARDVLRSIIHVELLVDGRWDWLDLSAKLLLDLVEVEPVIPVDEVDGQTKVSETSRTTDTVEVGLSVLWEVEVDDNVHSLDIDTTSQEIGANKVAAVTIPEVMEDAVTVVLKHAGVGVETRVTELGDLLGQKLHTGSRVTEDDGLVDLKAGEEGVQAVDLLLLFDEGVVLSDTAEGELVHQVNLVWVVHVLVLWLLLVRCGIQQDYHTYLEILNNHGESGGKEHDLAVLGVECKQLFDGRCELGRQELVRFIHDESVCLREVRNALAGKIKNPSRCRNDDMYCFIQADDVVLETSSSCCDHDVDTEMLAQSLADL